MEINKEIEYAIQLLRQNDYIVIKITPQIQKEMDEWEEMGESGKDKDCCECACNMCVMQG